MLRERLVFAAKYHAGCSSIVAVEGVAVSVPFVPVTVPVVAVFVVAQDDTRAAHAPGAVA